MEKYLKILQFVSVLTGLSGLTVIYLLKRLHNFWIIILIVLVGISLMSFSKPFNKNRSVKGENKMSKLYESAIENADSSIKIFCLDLSWIRGEENRLKNAIERGVEINIICKSSISFVVQQDIDLAKNIGINVKTYNNNINPNYRFFLKDSNNPESAILLFTRKISTSKSKHSRLLGMNLIDGIHYTDIYHKQNEYPFIKCFDTLFDHLFQ